MPAKLGSTLILGRKKAYVLQYSPMRDEFIDDRNPGTLDATLSRPGHGLRNITDVENEIFIIHGRLRGGGQFISPVWGESKCLFTQDNGLGFDRVIGRTLVGLIIPEDAITTCDIAFGWDIAKTTTDPRVVGHGWLMQQIGLLEVINPGVTTVIEGSQRNTPPVQYLVIIALNDVGAYILISSLAAYTGIGSTDPVGIPKYPLARLLWSDYAGATTPLYPYVSYYQSLGYPNGNSVEDMRVVDVTIWTTADFLAVMADRFTRADSATDPGTGWTAVAGTWGISSGQAYVAADEAAGNLDYMFRDGVNADGLFTFRVKLPSAGASMCYCILRAAAGVKFISATINLGTSTLKIEVWDGGPNPAHELASTAYTWVNGTTYDITVGAYGNKYAVWVNSVLKIAWTADAGSHFLTATGVGYGVRGRNVIATWADHRFDNIAAYPHTITIPSELAAGKVPDVLVGGATLASDTFADTNGVRLFSHTPTLGGSWTEHLGVWTIQGNKASLVPVIGQNFVTQNLGITDAELTVDCITPGSFTTDYITSGFVMRYVDPYNYLTTRLTMSPAQVGQDEIELHECINNVDTVVKKVNLANYYAVGTTYAFKVQCKDDLIQVFLDGKPFLSYYIAISSPLGTRFGLTQTLNDDGTMFDNWVAKAL